MLAPARFVLLLAICVVAAPVAARAQPSPLLGCKHFVLTNDSAETQEIRPGVYRTILPGNVRLECDDLQIYADRAEYSPDDDWLTLTGNVSLKQPGLSIYAESARLNRRTKLGVFTNARGTAAISPDRVDKTLFGGMDPDVRFVTDSLEKVGPRKYKMKGGSFTSCAQPTPRWQMFASELTFTLDERVVLRNMLFKVKDVPVFYVPMIYYPINKEDRSTGILLPSFGSSTFGGFTLSNAFFWAIDRSQDLTLYHEYFKKSGQGFGAEYRGVSAPGSNVRGSLHIIDERAQLAADGTQVRPGRRSYDLRGDVSQGLPRGFRLIGSVNHFSNAETQQLYQENIFDFSQSTRRVAAELSGGIGRFRLRASYDQNDLYNSVSSASRRGYGPRVNLDGDTTLGRSRIYVGTRSEVAYVLRHDDLNRPETNHSMWRLDASPTIRMPLSNLPFLSANASASWRITEWFESLDLATNTQVPTPIMRQLLTVQARMTGPILARVWTPQTAEGLGIKHLIEPSLTYSWTSPFSRLPELVQLDGAEGQVGGTSSLTYELTTRVLARRKTATAPGTVREVLRGSLSQTYYTQPLAASFDPQYQPVAGLSPAGNFSSVQATVVATPVSSVSAQFRTDIDAKFRRPRTFSASGSINSRIAQVSAGWSKQQIILGLPGFEDPKYAPHFLNTSATFRKANGHFGGTYAFNFDVQHRSWLQQRIVGFYNSQCCGITLDYQTTNVAHLGRPELTKNHKFSFSFSLAGIGSFANPLGSFGG